MSDYIEREALRDALYEADAVTMRGVAIINTFPAADVRPVVRSSWEFLGNGDGICLHCGSLQKRIWDIAGWQNFCGHCGADMR